MLSQLRSITRIAGVGKQGPLTIVRAYSAASRGVAEVCHIDTHNLIDRNN
jgi:hypothetical protein